MKTQNEIKDKIYQRARQKNKRWRLNAGGMSVLCDDVEELAQLNFDREAFKEILYEERLHTNATCPASMQEILKREYGDFFPETVIEWVADQLFDAYASQGLVEIVE